MSVYVYRSWCSNMVAEFSLSYYSNGYIIGYKKIKKISDILYQSKQCRGEKKRTGQLNDNRFHVMKWRGC